MWVASSWSLTPVQAWLLQAVPSQCWRRLEYNNQPVVLRYFCLGCLSTRGCWLHVLFTTGSSSRGILVMVPMGESCRAKTSSDLPV